MKKTKIIIPALGILLLSTAASVTGTVAWFAANSTVTANNMNIKATVDSNFLAISKTSSLSAHLSTVNLAAPSGEVLPTNWVDNSGYKWVTAVGTDEITATAVGGYTALTGIAEANNFGTVGTGDAAKHYFVYDSVFVGLLNDSTSAADYNLICTVTFTPSVASELNKCLTVGLDVGADKAASADFDVRYVLNSAAAEATPVASTTVIIPGSSLYQEDTNGNAVGTEIKIYAFFNGDHAACTSYNAINLAGIDIDLEFDLVAA